MCRPGKACGFDEYVIHETAHEFVKLIEQLIRLASYAQKRCVSRNVTHLPMLTG